MMGRWQKSLEEEREQEQEQEQEQEEEEDGRAVWTR